MATTRTTSTQGARRRALGILAVSALLAAASLAVIAAAPGAPAATAAGGKVTVSAYGWPVKPFDRPHPVRANFGDPRTTFHGPATQAGILTSRGSFSFHFGVDIAVPDGTPVYPVRSGTATLLGGLNVQVDSGGGFKTQYWHIRPAIRQGQRVIAKQTVLGHVLKDTSTFTSPSSRPAAPSTRSRQDISARTLRRAHRCSARSPSAQVTRRARRSPVSLGRSRAGRARAGRHRAARPGRVGEPSRRAGAPRLARRARPEWPRRHPAHGRVRRPHEDPEERRVLVVLRPRRAAEREHLRTQRAWRTPGTYLYRLTRKPFDTRRLRNGIYRLVVTASDVRGNTSSLAQVFIVRNRAAT